MARSRAEGAKSGVPVKFVILDLGPVSDVDATAIHFLDDFISQVRAGIVLYAWGCVQQERGQQSAATRPAPFPAHPALPSPPPRPLSQLHDDGVQLVLANPTKDALLMLKRGGVYAKLGEERVHVNMADAVAYAQAQVKVLTAQNAV